jgi:lipoate-protein ligase B
VWRSRADKLVPDTLILLEHPPVVTVGRRPGAERHILVDRQMLQERGVAIYETDRGGDVTYHGPGQLVAYPIVGLVETGLGVHEYLRLLEAAVMSFLSDYGIIAGRDPEHSGVWVGRDKIAAIGIAVRRGVAMHGVAINLQPDLSPFSLILPCGIVGRGVTSAARLLGHGIDVAEARDRLARHFGQAFDLALDTITVEELRTRVDHPVQACVAS